MASEQELKKTNPLHKEFQALLDEDFKDRKVKEGEIIKATVTEITPTLGSIVQEVKFSDWALAFERQLNKEDFPTFGRPTIPHFKAIIYILDLQY